MELYKQRYASNDHADGNPFLNTTELADNDPEWQALLQCEDDRSKLIRILCCPEDIERGPKCGHPKDVLCGSCRIPICESCMKHAWLSKYNHSTPMALANDNFIGYTTDLITRYNVRWIEAAIVNPCWTNIMVYCVEEDYGHLMGEELGKQQFRTVVRGIELI